jgi:hypothetical protein
MGEIAEGAFIRRRHFFSAALQFTTTVTGADTPTLVVLTRKGFPSAVKSYW